MAKTTPKKELKWRILLFEMINDEYIPNKSIQSFTCYKKVESLVRGNNHSSRVFTTINKEQITLFGSFYSFEILVTPLGS